MIATQDPHAPPSDTKTLVTAESSKKNNAPALSREPSFMDTLAVVTTQETELYYWDMENEEFNHQGIVTAKIVKKEDFVYYLSCTTDGRQLLAHKIGNDMNQRWTTKMLTLTWNHLGENNSQHSWLLRFPDAESYNSMLQAFTPALWETLHQTPWSKMKVTFAFIFVVSHSSFPVQADEQRYVVSANDDIEMLDAEDDEEDEDEVQSELDPEEGSCSVLS